jgi:hypothetical protein
MKFSLRDLLLVTMIVVATLASPSAAIAGAPAPLVKAFEPYLKWLPSDTETLLGGQDLLIPFRREQIVKDDKVDFVQVARTFVAGDINLLDAGKVWEPLADRKVALALSGGRNYEGVSSFGGHRCEGCTILVLEKELPERGEDWIKAIRPKAKEVRKMGEREVLVFPSMVEMEAIFKLKPWQGTFILLLNAKTILCATSDAYLKEVLEQIDHPAEGPSRLGQRQEWKYVEPNSAAFMIRQVPEREMPRTLQAIVWNQSKRESKLIYVPSPKSLPAVEKYVRMRWNKAIHPNVKIERIAEDVVIAAFSTDGFSTIEAFLPSLGLNYAQGDSGPEAPE